MSKKLIVLLLVLLTVLGCKGNPAVGTWVSSGANGSMTATFRADMTFEVTDGKNAKPFAHGKYVINDHQVTLTNDIPASPGEISAKPGEPVLFSVNIVATISNDGKTLTALGMPFTKQ